MTSKLTNCLWYDGGAEDAARFYAATFPDSSVDRVNRTPIDTPGNKAGDVITAVDGHTVTSASELIAALPAGDGSHDVNLTVVRDKKEMKVKATLRRPDSA